MLTTINKTIFVNDKVKIEECANNFDAVFHASDLPPNINYVAFDNAYYTHFKITNYSNATNLHIDIADRFYVDTALETKMTLDSTYKGILNTNFIILILCHSTSEIDIYISAAHSTTGTVYIDLYENTEGDTINVNSLYNSGISLTYNNIGICKEEWIENRESFSSDSVFISEDLPYPSRIDVSVKEYNNIFEEHHLITNGMPSYTYNFTSYFANGFPSAVGTDFYMKMTSAYLADTQNSLADKFIITTTSFNSGGYAWPEVASIPYQIIKPKVIQSSGSLTLERTNSALSSQSLEELSAHSNLIIDFTLTGNNFLS